MNFGDAVSVPGCSVKSRHLETSSGCAAVDSLLGGAVPNTSFVVYDEISSRAYADVLLRLCVADGVHNGQDVLVVRSPLDSVDLTERIPTICKYGTDGEGERRSVHDAEGDKMKIAWRYAPSRQIDSSIAKQAPRYDLANSLTSEQLASSSVTHYSNENRSLTYRDLFAHLSILLRKPEHAKANGRRQPGSPKPRLLRIVIRGLGSPFFEDDYNLTPFLIRLPYLLRRSYAVVFASVDSSLLSQEVLKRLERSADVYLRMEVMTEEEKKMYDKAHGYLRVVSLPRLVSLCPPVPPSVDLSFELHRRSFDIRILHLPPALGDGSSSSGCSVAQQF